MTTHDPYHDDLQGPVEKFARVVLWSVVVGGPALFVGHLLARLLA